MDDRKTAGSADSTLLFIMGYKRLKSGEYPESVVRDLRSRGIGETDLAALLAEAAAKQRRNGLLRTILGMVVSLITILIVTAAHDAGFEIYGPGLAIGLILLANGCLKLKNAREIAKAVQPH